MSEKYKANTDHPYFITLTIQGWIDLFTRHQYTEIVTESLKHCYKKKNLVIHEYVVMSNHIHLILQNDDARLPDILRDMKRHIANAITDLLAADEKESRREWILKLFKYYAKYLKQNEQYVVWRKTNKPIVLDNQDIYNRCKVYIHQNPVKAMLVTEPHHWLYSSANADNPLAVILGKRFGDKE
ncbi:MAG: transposase [Bacteroidetes bacterium]|nr:transposase [Bacteroidota bacterium]